MADNLFSRAAAYVKKHQGTSFQDAIQLLKKKAPAKKAVGKVAKKKPAAKKRAVGKAPKKKVAITIKKSRNGVKLSLGATKKKASDRTEAVRRGYESVQRLTGITTGKLTQELKHLFDLEKHRDGHKAKMKVSGVKAADKVAIRRDIAKYNTAIKTAKAHISALKRSI